MAPRYLICHASDAGQLNHHVATIRPLLKFKMALTTQHTVAFVSADAPSLSFAGGHGLVVGHLFDRRFPHPQRLSLSAPEADAIVRSGGRQLISDFWGGYVAVWTNPQGQLDVLRDPSGAMPCLTWIDDGVTMVCSDIETLTDAGFHLPSVDWTNLSRLLFAPDLRSPRSGLTGISDLLAGTKLTCADGRCHVAALWSPWDYAASDGYMSDAEAAEKLRQVIEGCVTAWAAPFRNILLGVSGGLDSSVLAACLSTHVRTIGLNLTTGEPGGDERQYARSVAHHLNLPLLEAIHSPDDVDMARSGSPHLPRPIQYAISQSEVTTKRRLSHELGVDALFTGIGGDNVFCHTQSAAPLVDRWRTPGARANVWETLDDLCQLTGVSWLDCLSMAVRRGRQPSAYVWHGNGDFLQDPPEDGALCHPWLAAPENALPGKAAHIAMLVRIQGTIDGFERRTMPVQINPLLSQPIVEMCLAIPTWQWVSGGRNRAMVRRAFANRLPPLIINRRTKGGPDSFASGLLAQWRPQIERQLLDGELATKGIIDTIAVRSRFRDPKPFSPLEGMRIMALAEAEAWCATGP